MCKSIRHAHKHLTQTIGKRLPRWDSLLIFKTHTALDQEDGVG